MKTELETTADAIREWILDRSVKLEVKVSSGWTNAEVPQWAGSKSGFFPHRIKPAPRIRPIRVDELPYTFMLRHDHGLQGAASREHYKNNRDSLEYAIRADSEWSTDGITWNKFEKEVTE